MKPDPPTVPPRLRSVIWPFRQRTGCVSYVVDVDENPTTSERSFTSCPKLTVPPSVPRSCITPFLKRNACVSVRPEDGSTTPVSDQPVICPSPLIDRALLELPPNVPRFSMSPWFHRTALISGNPETGSTEPVCASPTVVARLLTAWAVL